MKKKFFVTLLLALSLPVFAGDKTGNGGGGHVCPDHVELYDFYEGRHPDLHNLKLWEMNPAFTTQNYIEMGLNKLEEQHPGLVPGIRNILNNIFAIPYEKLVRPIKIPRIPDADIPFVNEDCDYQQIANWNDRFETLFFSKRLFESLDPMGQAGLFFHEAFYKAGRDLNGINHSNHVRKLVAKLYSDGNITIDEIKNVFGDKILTAPKTGTCSVKIHFSAKPQRECVQRDTQTTLGLSSGSYQSSNNVFEVSCEDIHRSESITAEYLLTGRSLCDVTLEVEGVSYLMSQNIDSNHSFITFSNF